MTGELPVVVAFDFDGTLTHRDSVVPYLRRVAGTPRLVVGLARRAPRVALAVLRRDRDTLRAIATRAVFDGRAADLVAVHAEQHGAAIVANGLRPDTVARLGWHLAAGHRAVIVSASYEGYVRIVGSHLGVVDVLATELEADATGRLTGRLAGRNCRGTEKVARLERWLTDQGLARHQVELWAYGDSSGDAALLAVADHPIWVREALGSVAPTP